jgi:hypothetical protein
VAVVWAALVCATPAHAQPAQVFDYELKAVYLLNFGRFATWPPAALGPLDGSFRICVVGRDPFGPSLDETVAGETIAGRPVAAARLSRAEDAAGCHVLFVGDSENADLAAVLRSVETAGALTVSDLPQFLERGGMIQFVTERSRVRFAVNLAAVERARLTLSSELLRVAIRVARDLKPGA